MIKAIKIGEDINSFLNEHPEIRIVKRDGKIKSIHIPEDAILNFIFIADNTLYELMYTYKGELHHFVKK